MPNIVQNLGLPMKCFSDTLNNIIETQEILCFCGWICDTETKCIFVITWYFGFFFFFFAKCYVFILVLCANGTHTYKIFLSVNVVPFWWFCKTKYRGAGNITMFMIYTKHEVRTRFCKNLFFREISNVVQNLGLLTKYCVYQFNQQW